MRKIILMLSLFIAGLPACKQAPGFSESNLPTIVSGTGKDSKALLLVPVQNYAEDAGAALAAKLATPKFALVECDSLGGDSSSEIASTLRKRALAAKVVIGPERRLHIRGNAGLEEVKACQLLGAALFNYPMIELTFQNLTGLPEDLPQNTAEAEVVKSDFLLAQALFLALRGDYSPDEPRQKVDPRVGALMEMGGSHYAGSLSSAEDSNERLSSWESLLVPCYNGSSIAKGPKWAQKLARSAFRCLPSGHSSVVFQPGGSGLSYDLIRRNLMRSALLNDMALHDRSPDTVRPLATGGS